jgi:arsenical pump membrane protein
MLQAIGGPNVAIWMVAAAATGGVLVRPWRLPEAVWAVLGALVLVTAGWLPWRVAAMAVGKGLDVYLFLTGMMLLSEVARREGLFDWLAAFAVRRAKGSARTLFLLVYAVGVVVTTFLSNDATAVVLTPAVFAAATAAEAEPLPYLFVCAFVANAASFVLPISNPANLVLYDNHMPPLLVWLAHFTAPSVLAIVATLAGLVMLDWTHLRTPVRHTADHRSLSAGARVALLGIGATAAVLLGASLADIQLGLPTCLAGLMTAATVLIYKREAPWATLRGVSWLVLPLVAGLFVLVEGLGQTGLLTGLAVRLHQAAQADASGTAWGAGIGLAFLCNLVNNLPAGLIASQTSIAAHVPQTVTDALLIGVDLGPNLSITGSLATILWLTALRREGQTVSFGRFFARGLVVMPPALLLALAARLLLG